MTTPPLHETIAALTPDERIGLADLITRTLDALTPDDDPTDAGLRHSMRTAIEELKRYPICST